MNFFQRFADRIQALFSHRASADRLFRLGDEIAKLEDARNKLYIAFGRATLSQHDSTNAEHIALEIAEMDRLIHDKNQQLFQSNKKFKSND